MAEEDDVFEGMVKLVSADGFEFFIEKKYAIISGTIRNMLSSPGQFTETTENEIQFKDIKAVILEKVCQYFCYKVKYAKTEDAPEFPIELDITPELMMASDFLDC